jgi:putative hemolysin
MEEPIRFDLGLGSWPQTMVKHLFGLTAAERIYSTVRARSVGGTPGQFCRFALDSLGVSYDLPTKEIAALRHKGGPLLFVANHPLGAVDALLMMTLMEQVRPHFKFVGNSILTALPELAPALIPVHITGKKPHTSSNATALRALLRHLQRGGLAGLFPGGQVALPREYPWHPHLGRLLLRTRPTVVPLIFSNRSSNLFRNLGRWAPPLRIALLAREMLNFRGPLCFHLKAPITADQWPQGANGKELTHYMQRMTAEGST